MDDITVAKRRLALMFLLVRTKNIGQAIGSLLRIG